MICKVFNKKHIILIAINLFFLCQESFSQSPNWMSELEINLLEGGYADYTKPVCFEEVINGTDCFENNPKLKKILTCGGNQLRSKDNRFVVFNMIGTIYTRNPQKDQIIRILPPEGKSTYRVNTFYIYYIKNDISQSLGKEAALNWEDHVNYYSKKETLNKFNAEMAISYSINLQPKDYYKEKYNNLWVLLIRKGGGFIRMYCFYEDMSKRKLAKYKAKIESVFRYKD